ncbi:hypothetical protein [Saccharopolyspora hordei]|uniref:Uncharacterized protein n=1 Tax=Saccharopolyspora hordei TaxID=1838 RepID=A0A853AC56_9PSEU|nr:hypothetical protein [Saccharopolyspora hordei]NYI81436.1 hypothetical protein [Saccharopolyspora hordei]
MPEPFVGAGASLLDVGHRRAVAERGLGQLPLGQVGGLPERGELFAQGATLLGDGLGFAGHVDHSSECPWGC